MNDLDEDNTISFTAVQVKFLSTKVTLEDGRGENTEPRLHTYKPLEGEKSIRLLRCCVGPGQASMIFEFVTMLLDEAFDQYVAVSYC